MLKVTQLFRFSNLNTLYQEALQAKNLRYDTQQVAALTHLQNLNDQLLSTHSAWRRHAATISQTDDSNLRSYIPPKKQEQKPQRGFFSFFKQQFSTLNMHDDVRGVYLYGGSGSGKSFLSDLFYNQLTIAQKKREHFHEFMTGVHAELFDLQRSKKGYDPLLKVAARRAAQTRLLYLDEFQVTDVADASILRRLFENLLAKGMVLLATSNRHPTDLYKNGHQRQFFEPFIDLLQKKCDIVELKAQDYRLSLQKNNDSIDTTYVYPINDKNQSRFMKVLQLVSNSQTQTPQYTPVQLQPVKGRKIVVKKALGDVCIYEFQELMEAVMGDTDFRAICKHFKAIFISGMRHIDTKDRNLANRLIKLFDEAYFRQVKIYMLANAPMEDLITPPTHPQNEQDFALVRCHSRLVQFQTKSYKQQPSFSQVAHTPSP